MVSPTSSKVVGGTKLSLTTVAVMVKYTAPKQAQRMKRVEKYVEPYLEHVIHKLNLLFVVKVMCIGTISQTGLLFVGCGERFSKMVSR